MLICATLALVSPKSNSKNIYLDVTLHMEEDGKWDNHAVLKLDKDGKFVEKETKNSIINK